MSALILNSPGLYHIPGLFQYFATLSVIFFPNIQPETPLVELEGVSSCPITFYVGKRLRNPLTAASCQGALESEKGQSCCLRKADVYK